MGSNGLPRGWKHAPLKAVSTIVMGTSPRGASYNRDARGTPLLNGPTEFGERHPVPVQWTTAPNRLCQPGDLLFCVRGSTTGRMNWADRTYCLGRGLAAIRAKPDVCLPQFLAHFLATQAARILHEAVGGVFPNLNKPQIEGMALPLPPLSDQHRIVAQIEKLTFRLEHVRRLHHEAAKAVSEIFQAALESALNVNSTADWPTHSTRTVLTPVAGQVDPRAGPYADMPHVGPDSIESGTARLLPESIRTPRQLGLTSGKYLFGPEHVLYSKIRPALRKVALPDFVGVCSADMYPLLPNADLISREFLALSLLSPTFSRYAVDHSDRNAMPKINRTVLFAYQMPVPDKYRQEQIVRELFGLKERAEQLAAIQADIDAELQSFTPALLSKAFRGEL